jgi:hypothetical protein
LGPGGDITKRSPQERSKYANHEQPFHRSPHPSSAKIDSENRTTS